MLAAALATCGADPREWFARAQDGGTKATLRKRTERAQELGIFGAPSFTVGDELFWGDYRLEDAMECTMKHTP